MCGKGKGRGRGRCGAQRGVVSWASERGSVKINPRVSQKQLRFGDDVDKREFIKFAVTDAPFTHLFEVVIIRYDKVARDRGIVHMINTRARTSLNRT